MSETPTFLSVRNWTRYQHYGNRRPVWVKLYTHLADDRETRALSVSTRLLWIELLLMAAKYNNAIPNVARAIAAEAAIPEGQVRAGLEVLLTKRFVRETKTPRRASTLYATNGKKRTGWRYVRGSHSGTYLPDEDGTDYPPAGGRSA